MKRVYLVKSNDNYVGSFSTLEKAASYIKKRVNEECEDGNATSDLDDPIKPMHCEEWESVGNVDYKLGYTVWWYIMETWIDECLD